MDDGYGFDIIIAIILYTSINLIFCLITAKSFLKNMP